MPDHQKYSIVYAGAIAEGSNEQQVKDNFIEKLNIPQNKVDQLFSGKRMTLKKCLSKSNADKWQKKLLAIGAETAIVPFVDTESVNNNKQAKQSNKNSNKTHLKSDQTAPPSNQDEYDEEMLKNIRRAKAMIASQQLENKLSTKEQESPIKKLVVVSVVILVGFFALYFYADSML